MSREVNRESFTILIDTNAITAITLYLETCEIVKKDPDEINEIGEIKKLLKKQNIEEEWLAFTDRNGIKDGYKAFKYLKEKAERYEISIYLPVLAEIEALHLFTERKFDEILTRKGIPHRLRTKKVTRVCVDFDYNQIYKKWNSYKEKLEYQGIELVTPEKEGFGFWNDVLKISNLLMKYILMGNIDMLMYAIAIYLRADEIYTRDQEFKNIVRQLSKPPNSKWREISRSFKDDLIRSFPSFEIESSEKVERFSKNAQKAIEGVNGIKYDKNTKTLIIYGRLTEKEKNKLFKNKGLKPYKRVIKRLYQECQANKDKIKFPYGVP